MFSAEAGGASLAFCAGTSSTGEIPSKFSAEAFRLAALGLGFCGLGIPSKKGNNNTLRKGVLNVGGEEQSRVMIALMLAVRGALRGDELAVQVFSAREGM